MKTPSQTTEYLKQREDKEAIKALKERERHLRRVGRELSDILDRAIADGKVTQKGGEIEYPNFDCMEKEKGLNDVKNIFKEAGWSCQYRPQEDSSHSMTSRSEAYFTVHYFHLMPLKNAEKAREENKLTGGENKRDCPLSDKEREKVEARINERLRPYTTKRRPSLDDFTPI